MVMWMNTHAKNIKKSLEQEAADAISQSSAFALASMAFLAVLKEGFETSVFLLATFSVAQSAVWAAAGAVIGLIMAVFIGWGLYAGGIRINLGRFFRFTAGLFLVIQPTVKCLNSIRSRLPLKLTQHCKVLKRLLTRGKTARWPNVSHYCSVSHKACAKTLPLWPI